MDDSTTIEEMKLIVKNFCNARDWDQYHSAKDLAIGIITESSELLEFFRFKNETQQGDILSDESKRKEVSEELADVLFFILRFAQKFEIDLSDSFKIKMNKNFKNYPVDKTKGLNKKYTEY